MNKYTEELKKILKRSEIEAINIGSTYVGSEHILLSTIKLTNYLKNTGLTYEKIKNELTNENNKNKLIFYSEELLKIIEKTMSEKQDIDEEITLPSLLTKILEDSNTYAYKILEKLKINTRELIEELKTKDIETKVSLIKEIATNLNEEVKKGKIEKVIGREKEIEKIIEILARKNKNNPILIGEAGVGKTAIVEELARKIVNKNVPEFLKNKEILNLNLGDVIAGTKYRGEFEEKLSKIIKELENSNNLILFIDEIHTIVGAGGAEGAIDASNILKPALARGKIKCIGATTLDEFKATIEKDKALERRFQKIYIQEPNYEETKNILKKIKKDYENYHNVIIPDEIIDQTIKLSNKYIKYRKEPDKSIDILDEICASTSIIEKKTDYKKLETKIEKLTKEKNKFLINKDILNASIIKKQIDEIKNKLNKCTNKQTKNKVSIKTLKKILENKTNSTIYELENDNYLKELNNYLKTEIIDQEDIIDNLTIITKKFLNENNELPTSILLKGNTGVGKTTLIEKYAKKLNLNLIKLQMDEFTSETSINKIIGSHAGYIGYNEKNTIFEKIKTFPISIILIENYKKANEKVINLLKSILETGKLELSNNDIIYFNNSLFIFTDNLEELKENIGFINDITTNEKDIINFTYKIKMKNITEETLKKIITKEKSNITKQEKEYIIKNSNYKKENAKQIKKLIEEITTKEIVKNI